MMTRRARLNLTQDELANRANVSLRSITLWESGDGQPSLRMVNRLAQALSVPTNWLLGEDEEAGAQHSGESRSPRHERLVVKLSDLDDAEFDRIEPVIMGMIQALILSRGMNRSGSPGSNEVPSKRTYGSSIDPVVQYAAEEFGRAAVRIVKGRTESGSTIPPVDQPTEGVVPSPDHPAKISETDPKRKPSR